MLTRIANREDSDQTASSDLSLLRLSRADCFLQSSLFLVCPAFLGLFGQATACLGLFGHTTSV